jgi:hypothetical protein
MPQQTAAPSASQILYSGKWVWKYVSSGGQATTYDSGTFANQSKAALSKQAANLLKAWLAQVSKDLLASLQFVQVQAIGTSGQVIVQARAQAPSRALRGLGAFDLYAGLLGQPPNTCPTPASPEAQAKYKTCRDAAYNLAVSQCANYPGPKKECVDPNFYDNFNKSDCFKHCAENCTAAGPIKVAQEAINRPVTGVWNSGDQAVLDAQGLTFLDVAPGCKGPAPVPVGGVPAPKPTPTPSAASETPWGVILLAVAAAGGIYLAAS